jgi:hypothetical protein
MSDAPIEVIARIATTHNAGSKRPDAARAK